MPSTYTTNLGIEKIATGEQSGTWGTTTNTNLDLIDQAINGVITVTATGTGTSGSPNTLPITNGSVSNGRNKFIEINDGGDLGGDVFYQLTPNDAEKILFIRNSLTSQDLILFQGTYNASNDLVVPNGKDMLVKFSGTGSGSTVTDVFNDLKATKIDAATLSINGTEVTATAAELNILDDVTSTSSELNLVDGSSAGTIVNSKAVVYGASGEVNATTLQIGGSSITSTAAELNILDGVTATTAELNYLDIATLGTSAASKAITTDSDNETLISGAVRGTVTTDDDGSFDMNVTNNFKCTPDGDRELTFTNITQGQSGNIWLDNSGGHTITAAGTTYISGTDLTAISEVGEYFLSYYSDGTNVMVACSSALTSAGA